MASPTSTALPRCSAEGCTNEASLACPTCMELGLTDGIAFCGKECFKLAWKVHKKVHAMSPPASPSAPAPTSATAPEPSVAPEVAKSEASAHSDTSSEAMVQCDAQPSEMPETAAMACLYPPCRGHCYKEDSNLPSALEAYRSVVIQYRQCEGRPSIHLAESLYECSRVMLKCGYTEPTLKIAFMAENMFEKCGVEKDATYAGLHIILAEVATSHRDSRLAVCSYKKAIAVFEALNDADSETASLIHCNLGYAHKTIGDYKEAMHHYLECLHIQERTNKINTVLGAAIHHNIGKLYHATGDLDNAQKFLERALELRIRVLGPDHSDVGVSYCSIGEVYASRNDHAKALEYYQKDLEVTEKAFGRNHSAVAAAHMNISKAYRELGNISQAQAHCKVALVIGNEVFKRYDDLGAIWMEIAQLNLLSGGNPYASQMALGQAGVCYISEKPQLKPNMWASLTAKLEHAHKNGNAEEFGATFLAMLELSAPFSDPKYRYSKMEDDKEAQCDKDIDSIFQRTSVNATLPHQYWPRQPYTCGNISCT